MSRWLPLLGIPILAIAVLAAVGWFLFGGGGKDQVFIFKGLRGPQEASRIVDHPAANLKDYGGGAPNRMAILVTDPTSNWLGLVRAFRAQGVPLMVTRDPAKALRHRVILVYPMISGRNLSPPDLRALAAHVRSGGSLLTFHLAGGGLEELFGVAGAQEARTRSSIAWTQKTGVAEEDVTRVAGSGDRRLGTVGYSATTARVLGRFDDGSAAVTCRTVAGEACLMGLDLGGFAGRAMNGRSEGMGRSYANAYEPSLDVLARWVRDFYVAGEPAPWLLDTVPAGKTMSILLTHDVDYGKSVPNAGTYGDMIAAEGVRATFFIQTKYIRDYNDEVFFDDRAVPVVERLLGQGMEIGSHSVAHAMTFKDFPLGDGRERYPGYRPFVEARLKTRKATVLGELRVSRFLLEQTAGAKVVSFRPGHLSYPFSLPEALEAAGYRYSSSLTANMTMTHLPFQLTVGRESRALTPVYEFPVTIEDELGAPLAQRFDAADTLLRRIAEHRGMAVILIHPNVVGDKLGFERRLIAAWKDRAWMGTLADFGSWWAARDQLDADLVQENGRWVLKVASRDAVKDLVVLTPKTGGGRTVLTLSAGESRTAPVD